MSGALVVPLEHDGLMPDSKQLRAVLARALDRRRPGVCIVDIERAPCPYGSSWALEEIAIDLSDGSRIALVFKNLVCEVKGSAAQRVKPAFVTDPSREPWVYQKVLMDAAPGPPRLWAAVTDFAAGRHWLFIERVNGVPLAEIGDRDVWCSAAEWLGRFHATAPIRRAGRGPLLRHDQEYHRRWLARALRASQADAPRNDAARDMAHETLARLRALASAHKRAMETALAARPSFIHGEFYASNVLIEQFDATVAVHPVDWEMAAFGPALFDLAALMSGRWSANDRVAMAHSYRDGACSAGMRVPPLGDLLLDVAACRLLLAVQWLGWASDWMAPSDHRNDWLGEAELCARELLG